MTCQGLERKKGRLGRQNSTFRGGQQPSSTLSPAPQPVLFILSLPPFTSGLSFSLKLMNG